MQAGIITLTMNPCVDETRWYDAFGEGVIRREFQSGGKGINVARVLHNLGEDCAAVAPLGGETGRQCEELARSEGVQLVSVPVSAPTRVIVTHAICSTYEQRQDYVPGAALSDDDLTRLREAVLSSMEGRRIFCACGSAPDEKSAELVRDMLTEAKKRGMMTVLDANGPALAEGWKAEPDIVKPNEKELSQLMGREISEAEILYAVEELGQKGQTVLLTLGEKGAMCAGDGNLYCVPAVKVDTVNPVGSGDTFLAAWLHARIQGMDGMESAQFACRLAAENAAMFPAARVGGARAKTRLVMLTEHSPFMMGFVYLTQEGHAVVIDGGRPADMPWLFDVVGDRKITAWILTHPHIDHISGFVDVIENGERLAQIEKVYYNFPTVEFAERCEGNEDGGRRMFDRIEETIRDKAVIVQPGMQISVDELNIDFLFCGGERYEYPKPNLAVNESSIAFKMTAPGLRSVLFLGDLGPEGGRDLLQTCADKLPSDVVQMSHHGHSGVTKEVYEKIAPRVCLWCAPDWLWEEEDVEFEPELWGTKHQRKWMEELGVREHYVTKDGTQEIPLCAE